MPIRISKRVRPLLLLGLFGAALAALAACTPHHSQSTFGTAGPIAERQKDLFVLIFWVAIAVLIVVEAAIIFITLKFRRKRDQALPEQTHGNQRLEIAWTIAPALVLAVIAIPTVNMIFSLDREATEAAGNLEVVVTGHQWWWEVQYTGEDVVSANEIHIPVGVPVRVVLESDDVIHSFWVPKLAGKVDLIPNRTNQLVMEASQPGVFFGQCAEFCGEAHALMRFRVVAHQPDDFQAWLDGMRRPALSPEPGSLAETGQGIFAGNCSMCHSVSTAEAQAARAERSVQYARQGAFLADPRETRIISAPNLTHLTTRVTLGAGMVDMNEAELTAWIKDPSSIKPGNRMQTLAQVYRAGGLSDDQIRAVVAYLMTLKPAPPGEGGMVPGPGGAPADPVARGKQVFSTAGCSGCHSLGTDNIVGPGLGGMAQKAANRRPGMSASDYLHESIVNPSAFVVQGFAPVMPAIGQTLPASDIDALVAYLESLP